MLAIGEKYKAQLETALAKYTREDILWLPDNPALDRRLSAHADLSVFCAGETIFAAESVAKEIVNNITCHNLMTVRRSEQGDVYPKDAGLCVCSAGSWAIYNPKTVHPSIVPYLPPNHIRVRQGYARCSICVVSDEAIITSDKAISHRAAEYGLDVLTIEPGHVILDGYDYGFIGGASLTLSNSMIAFTGTLESHPDQYRILDFLKNHGKKPVFLTADPIFDIGGAVALP